MGYGANGIYTFDYPGHSATKHALDYPKSTLKFKELVIIDLQPVAYLGQGSPLWMEAIDNKDTGLSFVHKYKAVMLAGCWPFTTALHSASGRGSPRPSVTTGPSGV